jgi:hypothetical protein
VARHVEHIEIGLQRRPLNVVDLRVDEDPALLGGVPVLADPVVHEVAGVEVAAEAAAGAGRDPLGAQKGDQEHREVTAGADEARVERPGGGERPIVVGKEAIQPPVRRAEVGLGAALVRELHAIGLRPVHVQQEALHDAHERGHVARQLVERAAGRHWRWARVEIEDLSGGRHRSLSTRSAVRGGDITRAKEFHFSIRTNTAQGAVRAAALTASIFLEEAPCASTSRSIEVVRALDTGAPR